MEKEREYKMAKKKIDLTQMKEALRLVEEELEDLEEQSKKFMTVCIVYGRKFFRICV